MRGEYTTLHQVDWPYAELPPRARRIPWVGSWCSTDRGTTSACAENTSSCIHGHILARNYLRVRGEYASLMESLFWWMELPPRARRIQKQLLTTNPHQNYLRVRGEYAVLPGHLNNDVELPPRARRIHFARNPNFDFRGTTSACAENTPYRPQNHATGRNYLRVRGEY